MTYRLKTEPEEETTVVPTAVGSEEVPPKKDNAKSAPKKRVERLTSLDAFRGFIMVLLAANGFGIYALSQTEEPSNLWTLIDYDSFERFASHFEHPPWQSNFVPGSIDATSGNAWTKWKVSFWDLIQPAFMFMVGVAMPFSYTRRESFGQSSVKRTIHAFIRAAVLVLLGVFLYSEGYDSTRWIFPNVLAQIGLGYFFVYLLLGAPRWAQISAFCVILVATTLAIQFVPPAGDFVPEEVNASYERGEILAEPYRRWSKNWNLFHEFDVWFLNLFPRPDDAGEFEFNRGGYTTLNFVPSMATILLGVFCGQFLLVAPREWKTAGFLLIAAFLCTALGVVAGATCCPIIKRIWTPAWVLFSGGYVIGMMAIFYALFDLLPLKKLAFPLVVVGMNSIAVYMMGEMLRPWLWSEVVDRHFSFILDRTFALLGSVTGASLTGPQLQEAFAPVIEPTAVLIVIWLICYWMYRQRFFIRI